MKFFGRILIFVSLVISLNAEPKVFLNKDTILKGEPLELRVEIAGSDSKVSIGKNVFSENGVTAEYVGAEDNTTIINMKVSRKKVLKFRILSSKSGNLVTPKISISIDQQSFPIEGIAFTVKPEKYVPRQRTVDPIFDQFFSGNFPGFQERAYANPEDDDIKLKFYISRPKIYIGETTVGSYTLYYKNLDQPNFERNEQEPLEFPFFSIEYLPNVNISLPPSAILQGSEYRITPYNREVFALTPLKKGIYELGAAKFMVEGNPLSYFSPVEKESQKTKVEVLDLPFPRPNNFSGEVGDYKIQIQMSSKEAAVNVPHSFSIRIFGQGAGALFKDPLQNFCAAKVCKADITFVEENKSKKFAKLNSGEYGFESESVFKYSLYPREKGTLNLGEVEVVYFNPMTEKYETASVNFPTLNIKDAPIIPTKVIPNIPSINYKLWIFYFIISGFVMFGFYLLRLEIFNYVKNLATRLPIPFQRGKIDPDLARLDKVIGNKKGTLLKVFLQGKGLNRTKVTELVRLKSNAGNLTLSEIYERSENHQKEIILNLIKEIIKENKLI